MDFSHTADTDGFAEIDMTGNGGSAGVEPSTYELNKGQKDHGAEGVGCGARKRSMYQSIDWGGSSLEGEVLTVSTQPSVEI